MQGIFSVVNASSIYFINIYSSGEKVDLMVTDYVGAVVWLMGFLIEVISDK